MPKKRKASEQSSIRDLIAKKTPTSLEEAWLQMQSETGCGQVERHPAYKDYMLTDQALRGFSLLSSV